MDWNIYFLAGLTSKMAKMQVEGEEEEEDEDGNVMQANGH